MFLAIVNTMGRMVHYVEDTPEELVNALANDNVIDIHTGEARNDVFYYAVGEELELTFTPRKPIIELLAWKSK